MVKVQSYMEQNSEWVKDQHYINNLIHMFFNLTSETNITAAIQRNLKYALNYQIKFDPDLDVQLIEEDNMIRQVRLNTAMIAVQGHLVNLFEFSPIASQLGPILINYYTYIYPVFEVFKPNYKATWTPALLYLICMMLFTSLIVTLWIYYAIKIDIKCFDIILWFLDIPVAYVTYLQANCTIYIKSRVPVK
jgi:hypothetical protein